VKRREERNKKRTEECRKYKAEIEVLLRYNRPYFGASLVPATSATMQLDPEERGCYPLRNVGTHSQIDKALCPRRPES